MKTCNDTVLQYVFNVRFRFTCTSRLSGLIRGESGVHNVAGAGLSEDSASLLASIIVCEGSPQDVARSHVLVDCASIEGRVAHEGACGDITSGVCLHRSALLKTVAHSMPYTHSHSGMPDPQAAAKRSSTLGKVWVGPISCTRQAERPQTVLESDRIIVRYGAAEIRHGTPKLCLKRFGGSH